VLGSARTTRQNQGRENRESGKARTAVTHGR
jgi:hypothetical protein